MSNTTTAAGTKSHLDEFLEAIEVRVRPNSHQLAEMNGADQFVATSESLPGTIVLATSEAEAKKDFVNHAREALAVLADEVIAGMVDRQVQFNHRIRASEKAKIEQRARKAGMSLKVFMLNQCLYAPVYTGRDREAIDRLRRAAAEADNS